MVGGMGLTAERTLAALRGARGGSLRRESVDHARQIGARILQHAGINPDEVLLGGIALDGYLVLDGFDKPRGTFRVRHVPRPRHLPKATWLRAVAAGRTVNRILDAHHEQLVENAREEYREALRRFESLRTDLPRRARQRSAR